MNFKLNLAWMYPDLMSTYGDRGNIIVLKKRCEWRGIEVKVNEITLETSISELKKSDLIFMGGAQDRQQKIAGEDFLKRKGPVIKEMVEQGIPGLFVCAAYQAVGHYYQPYQGKRIPGPGIFDLYTEHPGDQTKRLIGNVLAELLVPLELKGQTIVGFENHGGRTHLGSNMQPLTRIIRGGGNNGEDGFEGAFFRNSIGSYFHGPLLPKNPGIADWLIKKALEIKYRKKILLTELNDELANRAKEVFI